MPMMGGQQLPLLALLAYTGSADSRQGQLEPGCTVLLHNKVLSVVGLLSDETDPMVSVMKVR